MITVCVTTVCGLRDLKMELFDSPFFESFNWIPIR
jgi:hypothetical protein